MTTKKAIQGTVVSAVEGIGKYMPTADAFSFLNSLVEAFRTEQQNRRDLAEIDARRDLLIALQMEQTLAELIDTKPLKAKGR